MVEWLFDDHGRERATVRGIPGSLVDIVFQTGEDVRDGYLEGTIVRKARVNGGEVEVLYWPGNPIRVHSVWWVTQ